MEEGGGRRLFGLIGFAFVRLDAGMAQGSAAFQRTPWRQSNQVLSVNIAYDNLLKSHTILSMDCALRREFLSRPPNIQAGWQPLREDLACKQDAQS